MTPIRTLATVAGGLLLWTGGAARSHACSPAQCPLSIRTFGAEGAAVPGNLVYFRVGGAEDTFSDLSLRTSGGEPIAASIREIGSDLVFAPVDPIAPGTEVELHYTQHCPTYRLPSFQVAYKFSTTAHEDIQRRTGWATVTAIGLADPGTTRESSFVDILYTPPVGGHLAHHFAAIDGERMEIYLDGSRREVRISTDCAPELEEVERDTCGQITSVPSGTHVVEFWSHSIGTLGDEEHVSISVETSCARTCPSSSGDEQAPLAHDHSAGDAVATAATGEAEHVAGQAEGSSPEAPPTAGGEPADSPGVASEAACQPSGGCRILAGTNPQTLDSAGARSLGALALLLVARCVRRRRLSGTTG